GLRVVPNSGLKVWEPAANSGTLVLPVEITPARCSRSMITALAVGTLSSNRGEPKVVRIPAVGMLSLCVSGTPKNGGSSRPSARAVSSCASAAAARSSAASSTRVTTALIAGLTASMRPRCSRSASVGRSRPVRMAVASSVRSRSAYAVMGGLSCAGSSRLGQVCVRPTRSQAGGQTIGGIGHGCGRFPHRRAAGPTARGKRTYCDPGRMDSGPDHEHRDRTHEETRCLHRHRQIRTAQARQSPPRRRIPLPPPGPTSRAWDWSSAASRRSSEWAICCLTRSGCSGSSPSSSVRSVRSSPVPGSGVTLPGTDETVTVKSLFSTKGAVMAVDSAMEHFAGFAPLPVDVSVILCVAVADCSGVLDAVRRPTLVGLPRRWVTFAVAFTAMVSQVMFDASFIVLLPLAALAFKAVGRSPVPGIVVAYASISAGYNASPLVTPSDAILSSLTTAAAQIVDADYVVTPLANYFWAIASSVVLAITVTLIVELVLAKRPGLDADIDPATVTEDARLELTAVERKGLVAASATLLAVTLVIVAVLAPANSPFRGEG